MLIKFLCLLLCLVGVSANAAVGIATKNISTVFLDAINGNDATAAFGDELRPALTLSNAISLLSNNSILVVRPGTYDTRGLVPVGYPNLANCDARLVGKTNVSILGQHGAVFRGTNDGIVFSYQWCSNLLISGITFRSVRTNSTVYDVSGITVFGMVTAYGTNEFVRFDNCRFENCNMFGLESGYGNNAGNNNQTRNLTVENSAFYLCGFTNMSGGGANPDGGAAALHMDGKIINCHIEGCSRGVEWYGDTSAVGSDYNALVRDSTFKNQFVRDIFFVGPNSLANGLIDNCAFIVDANSPRMNGAMIIGRYFQSMTIQNCTFTNLKSGVWPLYIESVAYGESANLRLTGNYVADCLTGFFGDWLDGAHIYNNTFKNVSDRPVSFTGRDIRITDNYFVNCGSSLYPVIWLPDRASTNILVSNNVFTKTTGVAGHSFIHVVAASLRNTRIVNNVFNDWIGGTPRIFDAGTATIQWNPNLSTFDTNDNLKVVGALSVGANGTAWWTNSFFTNVVLNFPATSLASADLPVTWSGATSTDIVLVNSPPGSTTTINGSYSGFSSNGAVYVRFQSGGTTQDPASGTFQVWINKLR